jgi:hypothetical protein
MAMTNAEKQAAWRERREQELQRARQLTKHFEEEMAHRIEAAQTVLHNKNNEVASTESYDREVGDLHPELQEAHRQIQLLRTITRLNPPGVKETLRPLLDSIAEEGRKHPATFSRAGFNYDVQMIAHHFEDWKDITDGDKLTRLCRPPLTALLKLARRRLYGDPGPSYIEEVVNLAAQLAATIDQWCRSIT